MSGRNAFRTAVVVASLSATAVLCLTDQQAFSQKSDPLRDKRLKMVTTCIEREGITNQRVLAAMRQVPEATFELWSDKGKKYAARLRELSPSADPVTRTYPARFTVVERPAFIGLGMTATLTFERADLAPVANVPLSAIFQHGTQPAVWVVDRATGEVSLRDVTIARWRDDTAAILSGVKQGELVATAGVHKLEPGQKVKPQLAPVR